MSGPHFRTSTFSGKETCVSDVFQEVEEEYRRAQMAKFWAQYRVPVIGGATALVLAVAGYQAWSYWRSEQIVASSRAFDSALKILEADDRKGAGERFAKLAKVGVAGYATLSRFQEAALRNDAGDRAAALKIYDEIAKSASDPLFGELAIVRSVLLTVETASLEETRTKIGGIAAGTSAWAPIGKELLAYASWRAGKKDEALKLYKQIIASDSVPEKTKRRSVEMKALIEGGLTLADINKLPPLPAGSSGGMSLLPPADLPRSLLNPEDMPAIPDPLKPSTDPAPTPADPLQPSTP